MLQTFVLPLGCHHFVFQIDHQLHRLFFGHFNTVFGEFNLTLGTLCHGDTAHFAFHDIESDHAFIEMDILG